MPASSIRPVAVRQMISPLKFVAQMGRRGMCGFKLDQCLVEAIHDDQSDAHAAAQLRAARVDRIEPVGAPEMGERGLGIADMGMHQPEWISAMQELGLSTSARRTVSAPRWNW